MGDIAVGQIRRSQLCRRSAASHDVVDGDLKRVLGVPHEGVVALPQLSKVVGRRRSVSMRLRVGGERATELGVLRVAPARQTGQLQSLVVVRTPSYTHIHTHTQLRSEHGI